MSDETSTKPGNPEGPSSATPELQKKLLMQRAELMGLKVSPNIGLETLRAKVHAAMEAENVKAAESIVDESENAPPAIAAEQQAASKAVIKKEETTREKRARLVKEAMKLVRLRITCLNPSKKDLPGEIFSVSNRWIGEVKKFIPFGDQTQNGYHVPYVLYLHLKERKFTHIQTKARPGRGEDIIVKTSDVPEFAIEVLDQLTQRELKALAQRQAMAAGTVEVT